MALVSGLDLGRTQDDMMSVQLLVDLLSGSLGDETQQKMCSQVTRVILAGNCLSSQTRDKEQLSKVTLFFIVL